MTAWTSAELKKIEAAEELELASLRRDDTLGKPVIIWVVRVGDDIYVRAYKGRTSPWFRGIHTCPGGRCQGTRHRGHIRAGGVEKDVDFVDETIADINDKIDSAYLTKYHRYPTYVAPMATTDARAATIKLVPRSNES